MKKENKKNVLLFVITILVVIALGVGAYIILGKDLNKNYILDSRESNQKYQLNYDELDKTGEVNKLGYIKLNNKSLSLSYTLDPESINMKDQTGILKIGDKSFEVYPYTTLYLLSNSIMIVEPNDCSSNLLVLDSDLNTRIQENSIYFDLEILGNMYKKFIDWNQKTITYYNKQDVRPIENNEIIFITEYQIDFSLEQVKNPVLTNNFETDTFVCEK